MTAKNETNDMNVSAVCLEAFNRHAKLVKYPFSPIGAGIQLDKEVEIGEERKLQNGVYSVMSGQKEHRMPLGVAMVGDLFESLQKAEDEAIAEGRLKRIKDDNGVEFVALSNKEDDIELNFNVTIEPIRIETSRGTRNFNAVDLAIALALMDAKTDEEREAIIKEADGDELSSLEMAFFKSSLPDEKTKRKRTENRPTLEYLNAAIDPLTNATMLSGESSFNLSDYWSDKDEKKEIKASGKTGGIIKAKVIAPNDVDIDAAYRTYALGDATRYWLDGVYSLANNGATTIKGSDLLKEYGGYKNPFDDGAAETMTEAARELDKARRTHIWYDATEEKRKGNEKLTRSIESQPVLGGAFSLDEYEGGIRDFTITFPASVDPFEFLPIGRFAKERNMLESFDQKLVMFKCRPNLNTRRAWQYIMRRAHANKMSNTVKLETMWRDMDLEPPNVDPVDKRGNERTPAQIEKLRAKNENDRRRRMVAMLDKMGKEKLESGQLKTWKVNYGANGKAESITVEKADGDAKK